MPSPTAFLRSAPMATIGVITAISLQDKGLHVVLNGGDYAFTVCRYGLANGNDMRLMHELFNVPISNYMPATCTCAIVVAYERRNEYIGMPICFGDKPEDIHKV